MLEKQVKKQRRHKRVRAKISGTNKIPRLCVFRSNKYTTAQIVDDEKGKMIITVDDKKINTKHKTQNTKLQPKTQKLDEKDENKKNDEKKKVQRTGKVAKAYEVGKIIAEKAIEKKIKKIVFDRGGYKYHGRVKAVAEGARDAGLEF